MLFATIVLTATNAFAFVRSENDSDTAYLYLKDRNVSFHLNQSCDSNLNFADCYTAVTNAIAAWNGHSCSDLVLGLIDETPEKTVGNDDYNLIVWRTSNVTGSLDYWSHGSSVIALTTTSYNSITGEILDTDIEVNAVNFTFSAQQTCPPNDMDIQSSVTHELGHCIGLGHSTDLNAVMYATAGEGENKKRILGQDDIDGLCTMYPVGKETPQLVSTHQNQNRGGCATSAVGFGDSQALLLLGCLLWFLRMLRPKEG